MKCAVCGQDVTGKSKCTNCGFTVYYAVGDKTKEIKEKIELLARKYRRKCADQIQISLYQCFLEEKEKKRIVKKEEWIPLISGRDLIPGSESWAEAKFCRQRLDQKVCLKIKKKWFQEEKIDKVMISPPIIFDFWRVGVRCRDDSHIQILLGRKDCFQTSEELDLFNMEQ